MSANASSWSITGNIIGLNAAGTGIVANEGSGITVLSTNNTIGGTTTLERNIISGNNTVGINLTGAGATNNLILGNYVGTSITGLVDLGNAEDGIQLDTGASNNTIGGLTATARNIISGNNNAGIAIDNGTTSDNTIIGNYIGLGSDGSTSIGNTHNGINVNAAVNTTIGSLTDTGGRNVISSNVIHGIGLTDAVSTYIYGNYIGTSAAGNVAKGNSGDGIRVQGTSSSSRIGWTTTTAANIIANNTGDGILVSSSSTTAASILGNSIYSNGEQGIDLGADNGNTINDAGDSDGGSNGTQNFPVISSATSSYTGTTLVGSVNSTANTRLRLEFFATRPAVADATYGEGERYLGFTTVTTDGSGNASYNFLLSNVWVNASDRITATATVDNNNGTFGGTSEFAVNTNATSSGVVVVDTTSDTSDGTTTSISSLGSSRGVDGRISLREAITATNNTTNGASADMIVFQIFGSGLQTITVGATALPSVSQALLIDGWTQPGYTSSPVIELNGNNAGTTVSGLTLVSGSGGSTIRGLTINRFTGHGISITSSNNTVIEGNWIGVSNTGTAKSANALDGINASNSSGLTIGGSTTASRNVLSGNNQRGFFGDNIDTSFFYGNYFGTDHTGTLDIDTGAANTLQSGMLLQNDSDGNQVGDTSNALRRNLFSGTNHYGMEILSATSQNNTVVGNYFGTDATGLIALGNTNGGFSFWGSGTGNLLGGNVIAGNTGNGVLVGSGSATAQIQGNYIGVGSNGSTIIGNTTGIRVEGAATNTLVGTNNDGSNDAAEVNTISGNSIGLIISGTGTTGTLVYGNYIGTDASGLLDRGNTGDGVQILAGATGNYIGNSGTARRNIIAGNGGDGIQIDGETSDGNFIYNNFIGLALTVQRFWQIKGMGFSSPRVPITQPSVEMDSVT